MSLWGDGMEADAIYIGATPAVALYAGSNLVWEADTFELPVQTGTNLKITQVFRAAQYGTTLKLDAANYEAPTLDNEGVLTITHTISTKQYGTILEVF